MFLIILSLNCFYTRFIPYKLISFKFRFIPLLFHPLSFFFFFHKSTDNAAIAYVYLQNTRNGKEEFLARQPACN